MHRVHHQRIPNVSWVFTDSGAAFEFNLLKESKDLGLQMSMVNRIVSR